MRSLWGIPGVQPGVFLAPGGYLLAVLISYAKRNSNAHHPKMFVAQKNKSYAKRQIPFVRKGNALMALLCESCRYLRLGVGASGGDVSTCVRVYANKWSGGYLLAVLISSWRAGSRPPQRTDS